MIFYFSATGNSLYAARKIAKSTKQKTVSIPVAMRQGFAEFSDEVIGVVFPVYGGEPPYMVREFLEKVKLRAEYFFVVVTYGRSPGVVADVVEKIARKAGITIDYMRTVRTADNYLPSFDMEKEKCSGFMAETDKRLYEICADVAARNKRSGAVRLKDRLTYNCYRFYALKHPESDWKNIKFETTDACVGCGLCAKVCPAGCLSVEKGKAVRKGDNCQICMACAHVCPHYAVKLSVPEANPVARYINPRVTVSDLIKANRASNGDKL